MQKENFKEKKDFSRKFAEIVCSHVRSYRGRVTRISDKLGINRCYFGVSEMGEMKIKYFFRTLDNMAEDDIDDAEMMLMELDELIQNYFKFIKKNG